MNEWAGGYPGALVSLDEGLEREFEDRLRESSTLAFRVAYGVLRHRQDAEDVAQDAFAKAYRHFRELRDRDRFRAWLVRMTWRLAIDRWRSERRRTVREQAVAATPADRDDRAGLVSRERAEQLWRAIDALPEKLRIAIVLSAIEGHDVRTVADSAGIARGYREVAVVSGPEGAGEELAMSFEHATTR